MAYPSEPFQYETCTASAEGKTVTIRAEGEISPEDWAEAVALIGLRPGDRYPEHFSFHYAVENDGEVFVITKKGDTRG